ncbi:MAG: RagB/SusD family nutrient uptake outer membrane protein [Parabacteroides sp.]|nr:RagB/SusD family nutrient uptake outer membrane protein [Parabacteroides sp.]
MIEDADEQARADMIKGEAYLIRALCYHTLVVRFAKDYEPSSATSDLGMPLVLEMDPEGKPSRATLEETY